MKEKIIKIHEQCMLLSRYRTMVKQEMDLAHKFVEDGQMLPLK
jgi:hypothetical protein